ncbi:MAG: hypothetical protein ACJATT_004731 [Myxococcota bacterium]|jgi:hypothetical protein
MSESPSTPTKSWWPMGVAIAFALTSAITLSQMGRVVWCAQGDLVPWSFDIWSPHNSQHILDPYTFTHVLHGVMFYGILAIVFSDGAKRRAFLGRILSADTLDSLAPKIWFKTLILAFGKRQLRIRLMIAVVLESIWEVVENSQWIIDKYREATISLDYNGDSIMNSMADIGACIAGFMLAASLPVWGSVAFFIVVEVFLAWWIKDSLILNIIMLTYPIEAIKTWQSGGTP